MDCLNCKHRIPVPGSTHSACALVGDEIARTQTAMAVAKGYTLMLKNKETGKKEPFIEIDPHGTRNGWANWPIDFDPIWIVKCMAFTPKS